MSGQLLETLVRRQESVSVEDWLSFWAGVTSGRANQAEAVGVLASAATWLPDTATVRAFIESLAPEPQSTPAMDAVNIVGTGGGPATMNISTAAAFVAASTGTAIIKTGSRSYASTLGSVDLLGRAGIAAAADSAETELHLNRFGLAFAGQYVYPKELTRLARLIVPVGMKTFGKFLNAVGPFLADVPVRAQLTGVSARAPLAMIRELAQVHQPHPVWVTSNDHGVDELLSFTANSVYRPDGTVEHLEPGSVADGGGRLMDLEPVGPDAAVGHFMAALDGTVNPTVTNTICLNAAALLLAGGREQSWRAAFDVAMDSVTSGLALALADRMTVQDATAGRGIRT